MNYDNLMSVIKNFYLVYQGRSKIHSKETFETPYIPIKNIQKVIKVN